MFSDGRSAGLAGTGSETTAAGSGAVDPAAGLRTLLPTLICRSAWKAAMSNIVTKKIKKRSSTLAADGTFVGLVAELLGALRTQAQVSAG